ncbi:hypothetical protein ABZ615_11515 [Streptomyces sp. NPDC007325]|uniref:hypothetical protein n=1 Tax=Streptomyces sp. NPDC007325 TaxID=3154588 RepID=UPI0033E0FF23
MVGAVLGGTEDPFFRRPLWLQTRCAGHVLWAYNEEHVDELSAYVGARLRERGGARPTMSMFARLPAWMKVSDNRPEVLTGLETLRVLANRRAPADRPMSRPAAVTVPERAGVCASEAALISLEGPGHTHSLMVAMRTGAS